LDEPRNVGSGRKLHDEMYMITHDPDLHDARIVAARDCHSTGTMHVGAGLRARARARPRGDTRAKSARSARECALNRAHTIHHPGYQPGWLDTACAGHILR
jgi:hypothetical protein